VTDPADAALDRLDEEILAAVGRIDPPPADLDAMVRFAIALENVDAEVARLTDDQLVGSGARDSGRTRTLTYEAEHRTIMVSLADAGAGRVRVDGWLAPAARLRGDMRIAGRFVFADVPRGLAQLVVHPADERGARVVTPSMKL
jgi:hypothetical protein